MGFCLGLILDYIIASKIASAKLAWYFRVPTALILAVVNAWLSTLIGDYVFSVVTGADFNKIAISSLLLGLFLHPPIVLLFTEHKTYSSIEASLEVSSMRPEDPYTSRISIAKEALHRRGFQVDFDEARLIWLVSPVTGAAESREISTVEELENLAGLGASNHSLQGRRP